MVYERRSFDTNIWRLDLASGSPGSLSRVVSSSADDNDPQLSPDGNELLFSSNRSGRHQVWVSDARGGQARPLLRTVGAGGARWSADGSRNRVRIAGIRTSHRYRRSGWNGPATARGSSGRRGSVFLARRKMDLLLLRPFANRGDSASGRSVTPRAVTIRASRFRSRSARARIQRNRTMGPTSTSHRASASGRSGECRPPAGRKNWSSTSRCTGATSPWLATASTTSRFLQPAAPHPASSTELPAMPSSSSDSPTRRR